MGGDEKGSKMDVDERRPSTGPKSAARSMPTKKIAVAPTSGKVQSGRRQPGKVQWHRPVEKCSLVDVDQEKCSGVDKWKSEVWLMSTSGKVQWRQRLYNIMVDVDGCLFLGRQ